MVAVSILAILASMGVPIYRSALRTARIQRAKQDLRTISLVIAQYQLENGGILLPLTLADVGHGGRLDPWGNPYMYLNFQTGTGSGMDFALRNNLVDPAALPPPSDPESDERSEDPDARLTGDALRAELERKQVLPAPPPDVKARIDQTKRRDRFLFPLNTDFDLFSLGPNRAMSPSIGEALSLDDVIRANNGGFFGLASDY